MAFVGRSNVGKSSLLNALVARKGLARVSATPGKTRLLNVFRLPGFYLVDLPGYGFARASKPDRAAFRRLLESYLQGRDTLAGVVWLLDIRHDLSEEDRAVRALLSASERPVLPVLTKADKPEDAGIAAAQEAAVDAIKRRPAAHPDVLVVSAHSGLGLDLLRAEIAALA